MFRVKTSLWRRIILQLRLLSVVLQIRKSWTHERKTTSEIRGCNDGMDEGSFLKLLLLLTVFFAISSCFGNSRMETTSAGAIGAAPGPDAARINPAPDNSNSPKRDGSNSPHRSGSRSPPRSLSRQGSLTRVGSFGRQGSNVSAILREDQKMIDLQKSIKMIDAWPATRNGWFAMR